MLQRVFRSVRIGRRVRGLSPRPTAVAALVVFFFALSTAAAFAQPSVFVAALGNPDNPALSEVVSKAASVELQSTGLSTTVESSSDFGKLREPAARQKASDLHADFLLIIAYSEQGGIVKMTLSFRRADDGTTIAAEEKSAPFDLNLDAHVSDSVRTLLSNPAVKKAIDAAGRRAPTVGGRSGRTAAGAPHRRLRFAMNLTGFPLILIGDASNYFRYGAGVSLTSGVSDSLPALTLDGGALTGAVQLFPAAGSSQGKVYTFLGGLQVRVGTRDDLSMQLSAQATGGAAVILLVPAAGSAEAKTDLFAGGGVAATLRIAKAVKVGAELGVLAVFEERYPIVAFTPALTVGYSP